MILQNFEKSILCNRRGMEERISKLIHQPFSFSITDEENPTVYVAEEDFEAVSAFLGKSEWSYEQREDFAAALFSRALGWDFAHRIIIVDEGINILALR